MRDASETLSSVGPDGIIRCALPGRSKERQCAVPVIKEGRVIHHRGGRVYHSFSLGELLRALVDSGQGNLDEVLEEFYSLKQTDSLLPYHQINGLLVMGPAEIEQAFLSKNEENPNPLGLPDGWCQALAPPVPWSVDELKRVVEYCRTRDWQCQPILRLMLREIICQGESHPTSLAKMYRWFGRPQGGYGPGIVRADVHYSNWYLKQTEDWVNAPAVLQTEWQIGYLPHPFWTTSKTWDAQQKEVLKYPGIRFAGASEEVWMMGILEANGIKCRQTTWTRTSTLFDGAPLDATLYSSGVSLTRCWLPGDASPSVGVAAAGVWHLAV